MAYLALPACDEKEEEEENVVKKKKKEVVEVPLTTRLFGDDWQRVRAERLRAIRHDLAQSSKPATRDRICEEMARVPSLLPARLMTTAQKQSALRDTCKMVAPMVRYSKLPFRALCRELGADLCFSPMIVADSFVRSLAARDADFSTAAEDRPLVVQFAAKDPITLGRAAQRVAQQRAADGVDLNCGCPQRWAMQQRLGAWLSEHDVDGVAEMLRHVRTLKSEGLLPAQFAVSVKIRLNSDVRRSVSLLRQCLSVVRADGEGAPVLDWLTVHGRTQPERTRVHVDCAAIRTLSEHAGALPLVFNGDVDSHDALVDAARLTATQGVMSARAVLGDPTLFDWRAVVGVDQSESPRLAAERSLHCVRRYVALAARFGGHFDAHWHHLMYLTTQRGNGFCSKADKRDFNSRKSWPAVLDFLEQRGWL